MLGILGLAGTLYADGNRHTKGFVIPEAKPAPQDLERKAQEIFEHGKWESIEVFKMDNCTDIDKRKLKGCPEECPPDNIFGMMTIDDVDYHFQSSAGKVLTLHGRDPKLLYDIYWWNTPKNQVRDGPYKFNHSTRRWLKIEPWWLQKR